MAQLDHTCAVDKEGVLCESRLKLQLKSVPVGQSCLIPSKCFSGVVSNKGFWNYWLLGEERKGEILGSVNAWMAKEAKEEGGHSTIKGRGNARGLPYAEAD